MAAGSMNTTSQWWPSGSWKLRPYMGPCSMGSFAGDPPVARAVSTSSSTRCRLSTPGRAPSIASVRAIRCTSWSARTAEHGEVWCRPNVFDRRRYMLLCVVVAELLLVPVTTIGLLADRVVQATVADDALARSWWLITQRGQTPKAASRERTLIADKPDRNRRPCHRRRDAAPINHQDRAGPVTLVLPGERPPTRTG